MMRHTLWGLMFAGCMVMAAGCGDEDAIQKEAADNCGRIAARVSACNASVHQHKWGFNEGRCRDEYVKSKHDVINGDNQDAKYIRGCDSCLPSYACDEMMANCPCELLISTQP